MASVLEKLQALLLLSPYDTRRSAAHEAVLLVFILNPEPSPKNLGYYAILETSDDIEYLTDRARWLCQQLNVEEIEFRIRPTRKLLEIDDQASTQEIQIRDSTENPELKSKVERLREQIRSRKQKLEALMDSWQSAEYVPESPQHLAQLAYQLLRSRQNMTKLDQQLESNRQQYNQTLTTIQQVAKVRDSSTLCNWFPLLKQHLAAFDDLPLAEQIISCFEAHLASILPPPSPIVPKTEFPAVIPESITIAVDTVLDGPAPSLSSSLHQLGQALEGTAVPVPEVASLPTAAEVNSSSDVPVATPGPVTIGSNTAELPSSIPVEVVPEVASLPVPEVASLPVPEVASLPVPEVASLPVPEVASLPVPEVTPDAEIESEAEVTFSVAPETTLPGATGLAPTETGGKKKKKRKKPTH
jgi:hypothetical protein